MPTSEQISALAGLFEEEGYGQPPEETSRYRPFRPSLNDIQSECFDAVKEHLYNLFYGERYSGKTIVGLHALVDHVRENVNATALIIVLTGRQGELGGAWAKLNGPIKEEWQKGGDAIFTEPKTNKFKDVFIWISNKHGGWGKVILLSMPFEGFIADRVKGMEPTFIMVDEAQTLGSDVYFTEIVQQLGRVQHVKHQPIVYCCNPDGPKHWIYQRFWVQSLGPDGNLLPDYYVRHLPVTDNAENVPPAYMRRLLETTKNNPTKYRRYVLGEWVDMPTGEALFKDEFSEELHIRGDAIKSIGILPLARLPMIVGWDLGSSHTSLHLMQAVATEEKIVWVIIDEVNQVDKRTPYVVLVPKLIERMKRWEERVKTVFQWIHISDDSAFNQFRAKDGSFDYQDIENISREYVEKHKLPDRFIIRMRACPKGPNSVEARVRGLKERLFTEEVLISATCVKTKEMLLNLEEDKDNRMKPKRSRFLHPFDSLTYPMHFYNARNRTPENDTGDVKAAVYPVR